MGGKARILTHQQTSKRLRIAVATLEDVRWLRRVGLARVKVGGRVVGFDERDVVAVLERGRQQLAPPNGRTG
jgi:hypothetical protein